MILNDWKSYNPGHNISEIYNNLGQVRFIGVGLWVAKGLKNYNVMKLRNGTKYSRMDHLKFVEDSF